MKQGDHIAWALATAEGAKRGHQFRHAELALVAQDAVLTLRAVHVQNTAFRVSTLGKLACSQVLQCFVCRVRLTGCPAGEAEDAAYGAHVRANGKRDVMRQEVELAVEHVETLKRYYAENGALSAVDVIRMHDAIRWCEDLMEEQVL